MVNKKEKGLKDVGYEPKKKPKKKKQNLEKQDFDKIRDLRNEVFNHILARQEEHATERIVEFLESKYFIYSIKNDKSSEIYFYDGGEIKPNGESFLKEKIREILLHAFTPQRANKIICKICADCGCEIEESSCGTW